MPRPNLQGILIRQVDMRFPPTGKKYRLSVTQELDGRCNVYYEHGPATGLNQGGVKASLVTEAEAMNKVASLISAKRNQRDSYVVDSDQRFNQPQPQPQPQPQKTKPRPRSTSVGSLSGADLSILRSSF